MPTEYDHTLRVKRNCEANIRTYQSIPNFSEWSITLSFYMALHAIHKFLAQQDNLDYHFRHPRSHIDTNNALIESNFPEEDYIDYMKLYHASRIARYTSYHIFERDYLRTDRIPELMEIALKLRAKYG